MRVTQPFDFAQDRELVERLVERLVEPQMGVFRQPLKIGEWREKEMAPEN
jgi:hypothetical protein